MLKKHAPLLVLALSTAAHGAGYQLAERSASGLGRAFSGEAAIGDDASILGSNPAGMSLLDDMSFAVGASFVFPSVDAEGLAFDGAGGATPVRDSNVIADAIIPYAYFTKKINDQVTVGIGSFTQYGLKADYSTAFATRTVTDFSELLTFNINPAISYRINEQWTVGAGFNALYADGNITSLQPGIGGNLFDLEGDDWGYGYNIGVLYELNEGTRFGLHYRSSIDLKLEGSAEVGLGFGAFPGGTFDGSLEVELPDTIELSAYHELNDKWAIHGDILWTNWSKFQSLDPKVHPLIDGALSKEQNWDDSFRFSIGATYKHNDRLTFRAGAAYDEAPVDSSHTTLRIPDADRFWVSLGASYVLNDCYTLDVGYTHVFADDVSLSPEALGGNTENFSGKVEGGVDIFSIGLSGSF